jgi:hypothetical protein
MAKINLSAKRLQIDKASSMVTMAIAGAVFILIFSLISSKALLDKRAYQARVIAKKEVAVKQLDDNIAAVSALENSYAEFVGRSENIIGGIKDGQGDRDGDNAKITLDALPSKYDFPALTTSLEKLIDENNTQIISIAGSDAELEQAETAGEGAPTPYPMTFSVEVAGAYDPMYNLLQIFERSIRPIQFQEIEFTADTAGRVQLKIDANTYYMPEKTLNIQTEVVK